MKRRTRNISVIISGMPSVGKTTAANAIADKYGLKHVAGGDMLKEMAIERGYKPSGSEWWDTLQGMAFLSERERNPNFDKEVDQRLEKYLKTGNVVMTSYSMPWLVRDDGLKLWFHASQKTRASRLAGRDSISNSKALVIIRKRDAENKRLYKKLYDIGFGEDLSPFHFIIDTNKMTAKEVAQASTKIVGEYARAKNEKTR
ncbi:MAG: AAA family ATPase [Thaumarchaeota archaeon]|nr:AAA family ATPase [Nitrososphaerota archaeon]